MKNGWTMTVAVLAAACFVGCVDILNESKSSDNSTNYEVNGDGSVTVTDGASGTETNISEAVAIVMSDAGRLVDGVLLPSDEQLLEGIEE